MKRQSICQEQPLSFYHYRDKDQVEVDVVIERGASAVAGVEVKAAATVTPAHPFRIRQAGEKRPQSIQEDRKSDQHTENTMRPLWRQQASVV